MGEGGVAAAGALGADGGGQGPAGSGQHDQFPGPGHPGVEQVALQHHPRAGGERDDDRGVFAALGAVDGDRVGVGQLVQLVEAVVHRFVLVGAHGEDVIFRGHPGHDAYRAVEDAGGALVVVVAQLGDLVADPEHPAAVPPLGPALRIRGEGLLEQQVQVPRPGRAGIRRATMSVTRSAVCSPSSQPNQKKSPKPASAGSCPALIRCALTTIPDCCACRKIFVSRTTGSDPAASRSRSTSPAPTDGSWSTSPTSSRCAPGATALTSLLARITSTIEVSSTTTRSASSGLSASKDGSPPGRSCSSRWMVAASWPVSSASRLAARPVGAASTILAPLARASSTTERTVNDLPQPGPPVSTATFEVRASRTAAACSGASSAPVRPRSQPTALSQSTAANPLSRSARAASRRSRA